SAAQAAERFRARLAEAGLRLELRLAGQPVMVEADRHRLDQVWTNLLENARQHTPSGGTVTMTVSVETGNGPRWALGEVRDTGRGIPREALPRIFERFYRVDPGRSRSAGGTGLGLAIVKHIVEAHGGSVEAESELGAGTAIRFRLPLAEC
ncbi:MAG TPA: ATP-binding protein, partial [Thermaerobacter sp.]